jgi:predicted HicB family RNase H-like nuclease
MEKSPQPVKHVNLPIPADLHARLVTLAAQEGRSLRKQIIWMLEQQLRQVEGHS